MRSFHRTYVTGVVCWQGTLTAPDTWSRPIGTCYYAFFLMCCGCDTSYIVSVHIQCQASIYTLSLCRGHPWRVRLAKQETLTPPGHLVSPLVCRGPWMSTVVLNCWCHSDNASVLLYFAYVLLVETNIFPEPVVFFPDYSLRTSLGTLSILLNDQVLQMEF